MIANYHTHTWRCRHAVGQDEAYVLSALEAGLRILGFSDHTPYWFEGDHYSSYRMFPDQLPDYVNSIESLRTQYADKIRIHLGLETEYYPKFFPELLSRLRDTPTEYMILGQHYPRNEVNDWYSGKATADENILREYCRQVCDAMETGLFSCLAHPGLIHYVGDHRTYRAHMVPVVRTAKACGVPLELNLLGIREGRHYPNRLVWELAAEENCPVILGCDAHSPEALNDPDTHRRALAFLEQLSLTPLQTLDLRPI